MKEPKVCLQKGVRESRTRCPGFAGLSEIGYRGVSVPNSSALHEFLRSPRNHNPVMNEYNLRAASRSFEAEEMTEACIFCIHKAASYGHQLFCRMWAVVF